MAGFTFLGVPIDSVGRAGGTEHGPAALRRLGLDRVTSADVGDVDVRIRGEVRDPSTGILASDDVLAATTAIREATEALLRAGDRPFLVGGCCTELVGALAAVRDVVGRTGVAYLDGHLDLSDGETSPTGEAADMPLSVVLGLGPEAWVDVCDGPSARVEDVVPIGYRDPDEVPTFEQVAPALGPAFRAVSKDDVVRQGPAAVGERVADELGGGAGRLWVHLDVDILGEDVFPATDYLMPDGLDLAQLVELMRPFAGAPDLIGVSIGCYNPEKYPGDACGRALVEALGRVFAG
jgi:arginase